MSASRASLNSVSEKVTEDVKQKGEFNDPVSHVLSKDKNYYRKKSENLQHKLDETKEKYQLALNKSNEELHQYDKEIYMLRSKLYNFTSSDILRYVGTLILAIMGIHQFNSCVHWFLFGAAVVLVIIPLITNYIEPLIAERNNKK